MQENNIFLKNINSIKNTEFVTELKKIQNTIGCVNSDILYPVDMIAKNWASNFQNPVMDRPYFLIGFSDGKFIRELIGITNNTNYIFIYEPSIASFLSVINTVDVSDVLGCSRVQVIVEGVNSDQLFDMISANVNYSNYKIIMFGLMPGYDRYAAAHSKVKELLEYSIELVKYEKTTDLTLASVSRENILRNLKSVFSQRMINQLIDKIKPIDKTQIPAIIVSAGPSLDKNILELKRAKKHALIIVVDTALKAILRAGIKPDLTVCIDPRKEVVLFKHDEIKNVPAVFGTDITYQVVEGHTGSKFYLGNGDDKFLNSFSLKYYDEKYGTLAAGGSVANTAYSLAVALGFTNIILVGQDLAFTGGVGHTKDAYDDDKKNKNDVLNMENLIEVDSIDGGKVLTEPRMQSYIKWFENSIRNNSKVNVIDATEGGALIRGTKIRKLSDVIDEMCKTDIDFESIISSIPSRYNSEQRAEIDSYLSDIVNKLSDLSLNLQAGIDAYDLLREALSTNNQGKINTAMSQVTKVNSLEETNPLMALVVKYAIEEQYELADELAKSDANDTMAVINNAKKTLLIYQNAIEKLKKDIWMIN